VPTVLLGGPWQWAHDVQPTSSANPPDWTVHLAWVLLAGVVAYGVLRRHATLRAWGLLLLGYVMDLGLLLVARATAFGPGVASEYRFFTDLAPAAALAVGLAFMQLPRARQTSRERDRPLLVVRIGPRPVGALVTLVCALGLVSQTVYARTFHEGLGSKGYMHRLDEGLAARGKVDLLDKELPETVSPSLITPWNRVSVMASLLSDKVSFPETSPDLVVVDDDGSLHKAVIEPGLFSREGTRPGCGWLVDSPGLDIPLDGTAFQWVWWMRIGYLASDDSHIRVWAGDSRVETTVQAGLNDLWVRVKGSFDYVRVSGLDDGVTMCVDTIELGQPVPGGYL
jgi:hypothetical protein